MNVESNHTAKRESEETDHGNAVAVQTTLGDEGLITFKQIRLHNTVAVLGAYFHGHV